MTTSTKEDVETLLAAYKKIQESLPHGKMDEVSELSITWETYMTKESAEGTESQVRPSLKLSFCKAGRHA